MKFVSAHVCVCALALSAAATLSVPLVGQDLLPVPPMAVLEPLLYSSGQHQNPTAVASVVHTHDVFVPGASSLRLLFASLNIGSDDAIRVSSPPTGEVHLLDQVELAKWEQTSGYFNGNHLRLELILAPGSAGSFTMTHALVGRDPFGAESICGTDDRIASSDFKSMRFSALSGGVAGSAGCTIWLAGSNDCALSAGHCFSGGTLLVGETMCPVSTSTGAVQHPPIQFQFTVQPATINFVNGGVGNDWGVCKLNLNNLGQSATALFGSFNVSPALPAAGNTIRITGYGTDSGTENQTLQTHTGPAVAPTGTQLRYATDTTGGNSGSPVINEATGNAIGIHTHGGCNATGGSNSGTSASLTAFQTAFNALCPSGPPPLPEYQVNRPASSLLIDGVVGSAFTAAVKQRCVGEVASLLGSGLNANLGQPFEVGINFVPLVPRSAGGTVLSGGLINLNLASGLIFLSTLGPVAGLPPWTGNFSLPIPVSSLGSISFQMLNMSPSLPAGYDLSQGCQLDGLGAVGAWPAGPTTDDSFVTVTLGGTTCLTSIPFYGVARTSFAVASNGRVLFGTGDTDFTPTVAEALLDNPFVGFWTDLNPAAGGTITISSPSAGFVSVNWNAVRIFGETTTATYSIGFDTQTGVVVLDGLTGIGTNAGTGTGDSEFLGISRGNSGATNLGPTTFTLGGSAAAGDANRMWYDFYLSSTATGRPASLLPGTLNRIVFTPLPNTNYAWQGF